MSREEAIIAIRALRERLEALEGSFVERTGPADGGLGMIEAEARACTRCALAASRTKVVFGCGSPTAELMFVGEGPGREEDRTGIPFVGRAGELLDKMIAAMGFAREDIYIANVVKCRPPGNRTPLPDEVAACGDYLVRQIEAIRPRVICALGSPAARTLLNTTTGITRLRGTFGDWRGIPVMPTFHPAYLLRSPGEKRKAWEDLQAIMAFLGR